MNLKALYSMLLQYVEATEPIGICIAINRMKRENLIDAWEWKALYDTLQIRRPKWYTSRFWYDKRFHKKGSFWWNCDEEGKQIRIQFLKSIIKKL